MTNNQLTAFRSDGGDISQGRIKEIADNAYGDEEKRYLAQRLLAVEAELQIHRNAEEAWEKFQSILNPDDPAAAQPCTRCGVTSTRPNGEHYCHIKTGETD